MKIIAFGIKLGFGLTLGRVLCAACGVLLGRALFGKEAMDKIINGNKANKPAE